MAGIRIPLLPTWVRWVVVALVAGFVFYASVLSVPPETAVDTFRPRLLPLDKWRHIVAYAALAGALVYASADWDAGRWRLAVAVVAITVCYGVSIEAGQALLPQRYFSLGDAYANALGSLVVVPWAALRPRLELVAVPER